MIDEYLVIKTSSCQKRLTGQLFLECVDEILNKTETSVDDKKETCEKINALFTRFN